MTLPALDSSIWQSSSRAFILGVRSAVTSILGLVLFATFIGIGAFSHDAGFSLTWAVAASALIWAGPAQIILISTSHAGASLVESALAVTLSAIRLLPMVVVVLPMLRTRQTRMHQLALPAHFTAVTFWVESVRLLPLVPRDKRIAFANGLGTGFVVLCVIATILGFGLAARLPPLFAAGILSLTPLVFLLSTIRNGRDIADRAALILGLAFYPLVSTYMHTGLDILVSGLSAGTIAYGLNWWARRK